MAKESKEQFTTESEIIKAVEDAEDRDLIEQLDTDFDLATGEPFEPDEGYQSYTSSAPVNWKDKVLDGLNSSEITIQIKLPEDASEQERRGASVGEHYLWGALSEIDRRYRNLNEPPLREQIGWHLGVRGGVALRSLIYLKNKQTVFDTLVWDIYNFRWEIGENGLLWAANKRKLTKSQIKAEYGEDIKTRDAELIDFWTETKNSILINGKFVKTPTAHGLNHVPVFLVSVGSMPTIVKDDGTSTLKNKFQSIYASSRDLYEPLNKVASTTLDIYERSKAGSLVHKSPTGKAALSEGDDPYLTFQEIKLKTDETLEPLELPPIPESIAIIHSLIDRDLQQSTLPYPLAYGGTTQAMSGAALSVLVENTRSVYNPFTSAGERAYTWLCEELLRQYAEKGAKTNTFKGYNGSKQFFVATVKPKEIDPSWYVSVTWQPKLPRDREREIMMAKAATSPTSQGGEPVLSMQTAREDILSLKNPDAEHDKIYEERAESLPPIMISKIAEALVNRGKPELARDIINLLNPQATQPQFPPNLLKAAIEALARNPETQPLAEQMAQAVTGQTQGQPTGQPKSQTQSPQSQPIVPENMTGG